MRQDWHLEPSARTQPCQHLDLVLAASRPMRAFLLFAYVVPGAQGATVLPEGLSQSLTGLGLSMCGPSGTQGLCLPHSRGAGLVGFVLT